MEPVIEETAAPDLQEEGHGAVPWEDPQLSRLSGFWRTLRQLLLAPGEFFAHLARTQGGASPAEPFAFALIAGTVGTLGFMFWYLLLWAVAERAVTGTPPIYGAAAGLALALFALTPLLVALNLAIGAFCLWAGSAMAGGAPGFKASWRTCCYAQGCLVLGLIPFLGAPVAGVLLLFLLYLGAQSLLTPPSPVRALAAWLIMLFLEGCCWGLLAGGLLVFLGLLGLLLFLGGG
jgi:hypothetical protein